MNRRMTLLLALAVALLPVPGNASDKAGSKKEPTRTYNQQEMVKEAKEFFGEGAQGIADVIARAFKDQGEPNAYIRGEEGGGAVGVGVRYGKGELHMTSGATVPVYWQGPSIGIDVGGNAAKTFVLVYNMDNADKLFQRFPGVEGSLYFVGGVGLHYLKKDSITLAPVRFGVGWRQGASIGYMHFSREKRLNPF